MALRVLHISSETILRQQLVFRYDAETECFIAEWWTPITYEREDE